MEKYTFKTMIPQYTPKGTPPRLCDCIDYNKTKSLIDEINNSNVTEEEKKFLKQAATRHVRFNYSKIADYYAHATPEMQKLMEASALVIVDIDNAIANGYAKFSGKINNIVHGE